MRGLIILSPWIEQILCGEKAWELRPQDTKIRETIALISAKGGRAARGSGMIVGTAQLSYTIGPMSISELVRHTCRHRVPAEQLRPWIKKWNGKAYAWVLADVRPLVPPVPYRHRRGQQTWVKLPDGIGQTKDRAAA